MFDVWDLYSFWQDGDAGGVALSVVDTGLAAATVVAVDGGSPPAVSAGAVLTGARLNVTVAELAFMLTVPNQPRRSPAGRMLGLTEDERGAVSRSAGLSSLLVRGLAAERGDRVQLAPDAAAVADGLGAPLIWAQLGLVGPDLQDGALLFESASTRFLLTPRAHRCFQAIGLDRTRPLAEPLLHIVRTFLEQQRPAVASIIVTTAQSVADGRGERSFILAVGLDGAWGWGVDPTPEVVEQDLTEAEAAQRFERELASFVRVTAP